MKSIGFFLFFFISILGYSKKLPSDILDKNASLVSYVKTYSHVQEENVIKVDEEKLINNIENWLIEFGVNLIYSRHKLVSSEQTDINDDIEKLGIVYRFNFKLIQESSLNIYQLKILSNRGEELLYKSAISEAKLFEKVEKEFKKIDYTKTGINKSEYDRSQFMRYKASEYNILKREQEVKIRTIKMDKGKLIAHSNSLPKDLNVNKLFYLPVLQEDYSDGQYFNAEVERYILEYPYAHKIYHSVGSLPASPDEMYKYGFKYRLRFQIREQGVITMIGMIGSSEGPVEMPIDYFKLYVQDISTGKYYSNIEAGNITQVMKEFIKSFE